MSDLLTTGWIAAAAVIGTPLALLALTGCLILVTVASLLARNPHTREHHLRLLRHLTRFAAALRAGRR